MTDWIDVKNKLPEHEQTVHVYTPVGQAICIFLDSKVVNEMLIKRGYESECVDVNEKPYYFTSQESKYNVLNNVTHWMALPLPPT